MKTRQVIFCIILFSTIGCKKQVEKERPEFIGTWFSRYGSVEYAKIVIDENSNAHYIFMDYGDIKGEHRGTARANDRKLKIGRILSFDILEYPHKIDTTSTSILAPTDASLTVWKKANWRMTLSGLHPQLLYLNGTFTYYKVDY